MSSPVRLADLTSRVLFRADLEHATFSPFALNSLINSSQRALYDLILASYGDDYYDKTSTIATVANTETYALPDDFYKLISLDVSLADRTFNLRKFNTEERNMYRDRPGWDVYTPLLYRLGLGTSEGGGSITLIPMPTGSYTLHLHYVPVCPLLSQPDDVFDDQNGWSDYIEVDVAIKLLQREESDISALLAEKAQIVDRIRTMAPQRDITQADRIHDVDFDGGWL